MLEIMREKTGNLPRTFIIYAVVTGTIKKTGGKPVYHRGYILKALRRKSWFVLDSSGKKRGLTSRLIGGLFLWILWETFGNQTQRSANTFGENHHETAFGRLI